MKRRNPNTDKDTNGRASSGGIEGILSGLSTLLGTLSNLAEKGEELKKSGAFKTNDGKDVAFHYGVSVRTAGGGREVHVAPFGNMRTGEAARQAPVREVREPMTDILEEEDHVLVIIEMPGIDKEDASIELADDVLTIEAEKGNKHYRKEVLVPAQGLSFNKKSLKCNNGVFEVRLTRAK
jgi:HSP20 family protein